MKKVKALFIVQLTMVYSLLMLLVSEYLFYDRLIGSAVAVDIMVENEGAFRKMIEWTETEDLELARFDENQDGYTAVYLMPDKRDKIISEKYILSPFRPIQIKSLSEAENIGFSSLYFVSAQSDKELNKMREELESKGITMEIRDFCSPAMLILSTSWINWKRVFFFAFLVFSLVLLSFVLLYKCVSEKIIGYEKKQGYLATVAVMSHNLFFCKEMVIASLFLFAVGLICVVPMGGFKYVYYTLFIFVLACVLLGLFYQLLIFLETWIIMIMRRKNPDGFIAKIAFAALGVLAMPGMMVALKDTCIDGRNMMKTREYTNVYKVVMNNIGQDQSLEKENEIRDFAEKAYKELTQKQSGFFMDSNDVACNDLMGLDSEQDGLIHERCNTHITVSPNFYKINPIQALDGEPVESKIDYDENTINLAVPEKFMHLREQLVEQFTEYLDFNRFLIGERVYSAASNETWNPNKGPLSVNIIPVKNGQSYYTFDDSVRRDENNSIVDAVAVIYTDNFHPSYILFTSSRALFFQYGEEQPVDDYLNEIVGIKGFIRADSVFKTAKKDFELDLLDFAVALLMLGINIWGYLEVSQLFFEKKRNVLFQLIPALAGLGICYLLSGFRVMRIMRFDVIKGAIMLLILEVTIYLIWGRKKGDTQK